MLQTLLQSGNGDTVRIEGTHGTALRRDRSDASDLDADQGRAESAASDGDATRRRLDHLITPLAESQHRAL